MYPTDMRIRCLWACAAALALPCAALSAAPSRKKAEKPAPRRAVSKDKVFSVMLSEGCKEIGPGKSAVFRWEGPGGSRASIYAVSASLTKKYMGDPRSAAIRALASKKRQKEEEDWIFSKRYKKTLDNGMVLHFFWYYPETWKRPLRILSGYISVSGELYRVSTRTSRSPGGLKPLFDVLGTMKPFHRPKRRKDLVDPERKPSLLRDRENPGVPLY